MLLLAGCAEEAPREPETVKPIRIFAVGESLVVGGKEFVGRAEASRSAALSFRIPGRLAEIPVRQGEPVAEGQVVARLDPRDLETRVKDVRSQLDQARAVMSQLRSGARAEDINRLRAALEARRSERDEAQADFERYASLRKQDIVSQQEFERIKARRDTAEANLESARQELAIGEKGARPEEIEAQQAKIRGLEARFEDARNNLADATLRAPFDGVVARVDASGFEDIQANQAIVRLQQTDPIDIVINLAEQDMARDRGEGDAVETGRVVARVRIPAVGDAWYPARVREFQAEADPQTQTFEVTLQIDQPPGEPVRPGMNAVVRGQAPGPDEGDAVFYAPLNAIFSDPELGKCVWRIDPETSRVGKQAVTCGEIVEDQVAIAGGLSAGDRIAASAVNLLREGMQVEPMKDPGAM